MAQPRCFNANLELKIWSYMLSFETIAYDIAVFSRRPFLIDVNFIVKMQVVFLQGNSLFRGLIKK